MAVKMSVDTSIASLCSKLEQHAITREGKALLQRFLSISNSLEQLERAGDSVLSGTEANGMLSLEGTSRLVGLASELSQLQFSVSQCRGLPFVTKIVPRIEAVRISIEKGLAAHFENAITTANVAAISQCMVFCLSSFLNTSATVPHQHLYQPIDH